MQKPRDTWPAFPLFSLNLSEKPRPPRPARQICNFSSANSRPRVSPLRSAGEPRVECLGLTAALNHQSAGPTPAWLREITLSRSSLPSPAVLSPLIPSDQPRLRMTSWYTASSENFRSPLWWSSQNPRWRLKINWTFQLWSWVSWYRVTWCPQGI